MERAPVEELIRIVLAGPMFLSALQHVKTVAFGLFGSFLEIYCRVFLELKLFVSLFVIVAHHQNLKSSCWIK